MTYSICSSDANFATSLLEILGNVQGKLGYLRVNQSGRDLRVTFEPKAVTWSGKVVQYVRRLFDSSFNINWGIGALVIKIQSFTNAEQTNAFRALQYISQCINERRIFRKIDTVIDENELRAVIQHLSNPTASTGLSPQLQVFVPLARNMIKLAAHPHGIRHFSAIYENDVAMKVLAGMNPLGLVKANPDDERAVLFAVRCHAQALNFSSLCGNRKVALEAVRHFGRALEYVDATLWADREFVIPAFRNDLTAARWLTLEQLRQFPLEECPTDMHKLLVLYYRDEVPAEFARLANQVQAMKGPKSVRDAALAALSDDIRRNVQAVLSMVEMITRRSTHSWMPS